MNTTINRLDEFKSQALEAIDAEMVSQKAQYVESRDPFANIKLWHSPKGSAAEARKWFVEVVDADANASIADVIAAMKQRIEDEIASKPRWYTTRHLWEVLAIIEACGSDLPGHCPRDPQEH
jgi:hypothetical protein